MSKDYKILVINPGSTSTKVTLFSNKQLLFEKKIEHSSKELANFNKIIDQYHFRQDIILNFLKEKGINLSTLNAVVGRGGLLKRDTCIWNC
jgi:butyrate kinase